MYLTVIGWCFGSFLLPYFTNLNEEALHRVLARQWLYRQTLRRDNPLWRGYLELLADVDCKKTLFELCWEHEEERCNAMVEQTNWF